MDFITSEQFHLQKTRRWETNRSDNAHSDSQAEDCMETYRVLEEMDWERIFMALGKKTQKMIDKGHLLNLTKDDEPVDVPRSGSRACLSEGTNQDDNLSPRRPDMKTLDPMKSSRRDPLSDFPQETQVPSPKFSNLDEGFKNKAKIERKAPVAKAFFQTMQWKQKKPVTAHGYARAEVSMDMAGKSKSLVEEMSLEAFDAMEETKKRADKVQLNLMELDEPLALEVPRSSRIRACVSESSNQEDNEPFGAYSDCDMALVDSKELTHGDQIFGRDGDKDNIIQWLLSDKTFNFYTDNFSAMVIVGEAGVGKTTLAKLVYDDSTVKENFNIRAWVHAADGSDAATISKAIFGSITGKPCSGRESLHLQTIIQEHVNGKRLLLVLDGFEDLHPSPWEHLQALFSGVRMVKFLVTCRRQSDAQATKHLKFYNLHPLPPDLSWNLFFECAFSEGPAFCKGYGRQETARLIEMGKQIASKCKGLPLAVKVLGGLLGYFRFEKTWRHVLESYQWKSANSEILTALQLSYKCMPPYLRACFLYCSLFPKGYKLDKYELVRLWMAQGYIKSRNNRRLEDVGIHYIEELQRMSFFDSSSNGDGTSTLHDLLYDLAKSKSDGECCSIKDGDACDISDEVRHLYVIGGDKSTHNLTSYVGTQRLFLNSFFYKSLDGTVRKSVLSFPQNYFLRALELKLHDDSAAAPEITHRPCSDKANVSSINFADFISLRYLRVCDKSMESLPASVCQLRLLQTLHLDKCSNLRELPNDIGNLVRLRYLGLSDASIQMLPDSVCRLFDLQSLILDRCRNLSALPDNIGRLSNLHHIGLSRTNIPRLPDSSCSLSKLPILKLDNCRQLVELPSSIGELVDLQSLEVTETKINSLPDSVCRMSSLLELDVAGSDLVKLPHGIGNLFNLSRLVLSHTNISILPKSLCRLWSLHTLKLDGCKNLGWLPSDIGNLAKLRELLLSSTNIAELPKSICKLSNLHRLELDGCMRLLCLPCSIGQLTSLCHINLSDTEIAELPASICQLTNLQTLEMNGCHKLSGMPADIGNLINLRDLQVTETQVRELPGSLCQLSKLKTLNLNGNSKLQELPSGIENLTNLRHLELYQVAIEVLPKQICQLSRLEKLNFEYMQKLPTDSYQ